MFANKILRVATYLLSIMVTLKYLGNVSIYIIFLMFLMLMKCKILDRISQNCGAVVLTINTFIVLGGIIIFDCISFSYGWVFWFVRLLADSLSRSHPWQFTKIITISTEIIYLSIYNRFIFFIL